MNLEHDIIEDVEFAYSLAKHLLVSEEWKRPLSAVKCSTGLESRAERNGVLRISMPRYEQLSHVERRIEVMSLLVDLQTGFIKRENFIWQRSAKKLGIIKDITANDLQECELCGTLTPLTRTRRCVECREVELAVKARPEIARKVLEVLDAETKS